MDRRQFIGLAAAMSLSGPDAAAEETPKFRIGAIADAQYADQNNNGVRMYRRTPAKLTEAIETLNTCGIDFAVHLGDFIDGDIKSYDVVLPITRRLSCPLYFVLGNHDFGVPEDRKLALPGMLDMPARYYSFEHKGWLFVVLDGNDLSTYGWPAGSPQDIESRTIHARKYPDAPTWDGGIGSMQLAWLDRVLSAADGRTQNVALLCHFPIYPENQHNLWNAHDVISHIAPHPSVKLWLNGHNHDGNYGVVSGIHCVNLNGMLDTKITAYATLSFFPGRIDIRGFGRQPDMSLTLR